jgi:hypothetical protein
MKLKIEWQKPRKLIDGRNQDLIYTIEGLDELYGMTGVYMFCRQHGTSLSPLYIGKAEDIGIRIKQHLKNNITLMMKIGRALNGNKVLVIGEFIAKPGQEKKKSISIIEQALIESALSKGYELLNVQGAKTPTHKINFSGCQSAKKMTRNSMNVAIKKEHEKIKKRKKYGTK